MGREKVYLSIKEVSPHSSDNFLCMIRSRSGQISQPLVHLMDKMSNTVIKMNHYASIVELDQEEIKNCEVGIVGAGLGGGFNHISELHVMKYDEKINGLMVRLG